MPSIHLTHALLILLLYETAVGKARDLTQTGACVLPIDSFTPPGPRDGPSYHSQKHPGDVNWKNVNAVDLKTPGQQPVVRAVEGGTVCSQSWCCRKKDGGSGVYGYQFTLTTPGGRVFFYTHLGSLAVACGASVARGQVLGTVAVGPNVNHLHFAMEKGNVCGYLRSCVSVNGVAGSSLLSGCS